MKRFFLLLLTILAGSLPALEIVPEFFQAPPMDGKFNPSFWEKGLCLQDFTFWKSNQNQPATEKTTVYMAQKGGTLYTAAVLSNEDVPALIEQIKKADLKKEAFAYNGIEFFLGDGQSFLQLAFDYMGRLYKNLDIPVYTKINYKRDQIIIRFSFSSEAIPRSPFCSDMTRLHIYRKSKSGVSTLYPNQNFQFTNLNNGGHVLLNSTEKIAEQLKSDYAQQIRISRDAGMLTEQETTALQNAIQEKALALARSGNDDQKFRQTFQDLKDMQKKILAGQEKKMRNRFGQLKNSRFLTAFKEIPRSWEPPKIHGRDYWYTFKTDRLPIYEELELLDLPLFRDAILYMPATPAKEYLPPDGKYYKILKKHSNLFCIKSLNRKEIPEQQRTSRTFTWYFDRDFISQFNKLYAKRFLGYWDDEAFVNSGFVFVESLRQQNIPLPGNRTEAFQAFATLYNRKYTSVPRYIPFRSVALTSALTAGNVSTASATQIASFVYRLGDPMSGAEFGEVMGNTATKIAFVRGASRQYGRPWRNYQTYYNFRNFPCQKPAWHSYCLMIDDRPFNDKRVNKILTPSCRVGRNPFGGPELGTTLELQKALALGPWLSGVGIWASECDNFEILSMYDDEKISQTDPLVINLRDQKFHLSSMAKLNIHLYDEVIRKRDRGVCVTPVALLYDRDHGYMPTYFENRIWDFFKPTDLEKTMWAMDRHIFRTIPGNPSYAVSPWGDIFDAVTNDASADFLNTYKVVYPVGDVTLDKKFAAELKGYVREGGMLILNAELLRKYPDAFDEEFLGCKITSQTRKTPGSYSLISGKIITEDQPCDYAELVSKESSPLAVSADQFQNPLILRHVYGKGSVLVTAPVNMKPQGSMDQMLHLFDHLMDWLRDQVLDIKIETSMQYMINRNTTGWIVYLQNNKGIPPNFGVNKKYLKTDTGKTATAVITCPPGMGKIKQAIDWWTGQSVPFTVTGGGTVITTTLPGGDCQALELKF